MTLVEIEDSLLDRASTRLGWLCLAYVPLSGGHRIL